MSKFQQQHYVFWAYEEYEDDPEADIPESSLHRLRTTNFKLVNLHCTRYPDCILEHTYLQ